jgi:hypothetical protein
MNRKRSTLGELKVPKEMEEEIKTLIASRPELGYETVREFVLTACFLRLLRERTPAEAPAQRP